MLQNINIDIIHIIDVINYYLLKISVGLIIRLQTLLLSLGLNRHVFESLTDMVSLSATDNLIIPIRLNLVK